jgi:hypothetical protein
VIRDFSPLRGVPQSTYQLGVRESNYPKGQSCYWPKGREPFS